MPTAVSATNPIDAVPAKMNGHANGAKPQSTAGVIDPQVLARPNLALWVNKEHK